MLFRSARRSRRAVPLAPHLLRSGGSTRPSERRRQTTRGRARRSRRRVHQATAPSPVRRFGAANRAATAKAADARGVRGGVGEYTPSWSTSIQEGLTQPSEEQEQELLSSRICTGDGSNSRKSESAGRRVTRKTVVVEEDGNGGPGGLLLRFT